MDGDQKFWLGVWVIVGVTVSVLILGSIHFSNQRMRLFVDNGYTREMLPGYPEWVKK